MRVLYNREKLASVLKKQNRMWAKLAKEHGKKFFESKGLFRYNGENFHQMYLDCHE